VISTSGSPYTDSRVQVNHVLSPAPDGVDEPAVPATEIRNGGVSRHVTLEEPLYQYLPELSRRCHRRGIEPALANLVVYRQTFLFVPLCKRHSIEYQGGADQGFFLPNSLIDVAKRLLSVLGRMSTVQVGHPEVIRDIQVDRWNTTRLLPLLTSTLVG